MVVWGFSAILSISLLQHARVPPPALITSTSLPQTLHRYISPTCLVAIYYLHPVCREPVMLTRGPCTDNRLRVSCTEGRVEEDILLDPFSLVLGNVDCRPLLRSDRRGKFCVRPCNCADDVTGAIRFYCYRKLDCLPGV